MKKSPDDSNPKQKMAKLKEQIKQLEAQLKEIAQFTIMETRPVNGYMYVRGLEKLYCIGR